MEKENNKVTELITGVTVDTRNPYEEFWDNELEEAFKYHKPNEEQVKAIEAIRAKSKELAQLIVDVVPEGAEKMQAITYLRQAGMFANAGIVINATDATAYGEKERKY